MSSLVLPNSIVKIPGEAPIMTLARMPLKESLALISEMDTDLLEVWLHDWGILGRPSQQEPEEFRSGKKSTWLALAGRGWGKTRTGIEWINGRVRGDSPLIAPKGAPAFIAIVAETAADARDVIAEGPAGFLHCTHPDYRPDYEPSKRRLTWPNGCIATLYNAVEPDQLRGPQHHLAWGDELAKWRYAQETYDMLQFGLRMGSNPQQMFTTTPRPTKLVKDIFSDEDTVVTQGSTYDNAANLAAPFLKRIVKRYEGTRLGRQELDAEILDDVPGALWDRANLDLHRVRKNEVPESMSRIVVAVDPPAEAGESADEAGIITVGKSFDGHGYIFADNSKQGSPDEWGREAVAAYYRSQADLMVAEVNNGGLMVGHTVKTINKEVNYKSVRASRGKVIRAEPCSALYEQGIIHHVGAFPLLEDQMCEMTIDFDPKKSGYSPDRVDALVWAVTELFFEGREGGPQIRQV